MSAAQLLERACQLAEQAERDPVRAVQNAEKLAATLRRVREEIPNAHASNDVAMQLGRVLERLEGILESASQPLAALGCTHIVRVDDVPSLTPGATSTLLKLDWPGGEGIARSMFAGTLDGDPASVSRVSVRIAINGSDDLFTTGEAPAYVPLIAFQAANHNWFRLRDYKVSPAQKWTLTFQHEGPANSPATTPFLLFGFVRGQ